MYTKIVAELKKHLSEEISDIAKYNLLAGLLPNEQAKMVIKIAQDESRHMAYLSRMIVLLGGRYELYPYNANINIQSSWIKDVLKSSIQDEEETAKSYLKLHDMVVASGTTYTVIEDMLKSMWMDERKHARILKTIYGQLRRH